ncbi:MAG: efflux RND transporter periplasmic adaptor subunit [Phycisphaerae bacterium]|jgi:RND family efflux transporter MFP subunit
MNRWVRRVRTGSVVIVSVGTIIVLLVWLAGGFHEKIEPGPTRPGLFPLGGAPATTVELVTVPAFEDAVGTVQASHETGVGAKIMARVLSANVRAGQHVERDQVLFELDRSDLEARHAQASAALDAAQASLDQAKTDHDRIARLRTQGSASEHEFTTAVNNLNTARANLERAVSAVEEAETVLGYATIRAPVGGVVIDKLVDVGDMASPGQTVVRLYDQLQLVATVRESLATSLELGQKLPVTLEALDLACYGTVSEIVPEADSLSRAFEVKVTGPCPPGVIPGMFGRLHIPLGERKELQIPRSAMRRTGQIPYVFRVVNDIQVARTFIQIAGEREDRVAIAAGLSAGDVIVSDADQLRQSPAAEPATR